LFVVTMISFVISYIKKYKILKKWSSPDFETNKNRLYI